MKIAVIGTRGIPASFGGIEKHCEEIYSQLVKLGHEITIYARKGYINPKIKEFNGIKIKPLWTFKSKYLEASFHTFWALIHIMFSDAEIIHFHAQGPCLFAWIPKLFTPKKKLVFTCHGIDWQRNKWNLFAKMSILIGEFFSAKLFKTQMVVSKALQKYYKEKYHINPITITNGTEVNPPQKADFITREFGLKEKEYLAFIGRLVPEKAPHKLIEAFKLVKTDKKLVIVGGASATDDYEKQLKVMAKDDNRIIFTSYLYDKNLAEIYSNAHLYVSTSELEGLPLTLLEAMSYGIPSLVSSIPPHIEVVGKNEELGFLFDSFEIKDIAKKIEIVLSLPAFILERKGLQGQEKIKQEHNWKKISKKIEMIFKIA